MYTNKSHTNPHTHIYIYIYIYIYTNLPIYQSIYFFIIQRVKARAIPCPHQQLTKGNYTVSVAEGGTATPDATKQLLPPDRVKRELYIYIYIYIYSSHTHQTQIYIHIYTSHTYTQHACIYIYIYIYLNL